MQSLLFVAGGFIAGIITVLAGGAQFITFPLLNIVGGLPTRIANGTSSMAVWPSPLLGGLMMRKEIKLQRSLLIKLLVISVVGSMIGALLVRTLTELQFVRIVPFLLLVAAISLTWGDYIRKILHKSTVATGSYRFLLLQFLMAVYAGIYGGGVAIVMLAVYGFFSFRSEKSPQALKNLLASVMNIAAAITFLLSGLVSWKFAIPLMFGNLIGGYIGAHLLQKLNPKTIKKAVVVFAWATTVYYFIK